MSDPDLLASGQTEEPRRRRGKLKIFLGYAAGVGKTYAMLQAARQRQAEGVDLVAGYVETHGQAETEALLAGLEVMPCRQLEHHGVTVPEMNVDALLARQPQLVLVDDLTHTNAPGSRHAKRYQDVEELLDAGIDVYATLNIQHLESLNDVVAQITGVTVRETIPDRILDEVNEIELVDLPPEELLQRLREGKVYLPDEAAPAAQKFFRPGNLTALREMAMRRAAERVDEQMRSYMQTRAIPGPWPAAERLMVCVSPSPLSERLVRAGRRLADPLNAEWVAVHVETPDYARLSEPERDRVARTLRLAEELGAKSITLPGRNAVEAIVEYANNHNITKIIAGKSLRPRWLDLVHHSLVDQLIRQCGHIDVYVVSNLASPMQLVRPINDPQGQSWSSYVESAAWVIAATLLGELIRRFINPTNLVMLYLLAVVIAALRLGRGPAIVASLLGILAFNFFFVPPRITFAVSDTQYLITFAGLLVVGLVISTLASRARDQAEAARRREAQTAAVYELSRDLAAAGGLDAIMQAVITHVGQTFSRQVIILLPHDNRLVRQAASPDFDFNDSEYAVAVWAFEHGQPAGRGTDTLSTAAARYLPLKTAAAVIGVLGVKPADPHNQLTPEQRRLLDTFASQAALAIARALLAEQARQTRLLQETEKLQTALLNSISHDLRTPLASITGVLSSLRDDRSFLDEATQRDLVDTAWGEANRMNRLVGNLLDMTRLEAGAMRVSREPADVQDLIGVTLAQLAGPIKERMVQVEIPAALPLVPMDFVLMVQVLVNVLDNALKYSPADTPLEIRANQTNDQVSIEVADRGLGIPPGDMERIFDKFYRVQRPNGGASGTGLGLSISKGIIEAHGGRITAQARPGGGTLITLSLPLDQPVPATQEAVHE